MAVRELASRAENDDDVWSLRGASRSAKAEGRSSRRRLVLLLLVLVVVLAGAYVARERILHSSKSSGERTETVLVTATRLRNPPELGTLSPLAWVPSPLALLSA